LIKVLLADTLSQRVVELLNEIPELEIIVKSGMALDQLKDEIKHVDALVVSGASTLEINQDILENADNLKIIVKTGIGLENIDVDFAHTRNIEVKHTPFATAITVAEYTLAQMLGICRFIGPAYKSMKAHKWEPKLFSQGMELFGKISGIIGMGRIGKEVAKRQIAMGMTVLYYDIIDIQTDLDAQQVSLEELLKTADFISVHLPLNKSTQNLISENEFGQMKNGVVFVNVSRGGIVDESALLDALNSGKIRAVGLDVYQEEPIKHFQLIDQENVFPAPHLGASTVEAHQRADLDAVSILKEFFNV
jgi:D-3-phosphoglycerate dehydrogenase